MKSKAFLTLFLGSFFMSVLTATEAVKPKVGVAVAVIHEGNILIGKRKGSHGSGEWAPPGGHLEFGESVEECAKRELLEETGILAKNVEAHHFCSNILGPDKHYITLLAVVTEFEGEPLLLEPNKCEGWEWFPLDALPEPLFAPVEPLLAKYKDTIPPHTKLLMKWQKMMTERDWEKFHSPKNLSMDLASEVGELLDLFRWMTEEESYRPDEATLQEIKGEMADVFKSVLYLAHKLGIDPIEVTYAKFEEFKKKYPVEKSKGIAKKHTAYRS